MATLFQRYLTLLIIMLKYTSFKIYNVDSTLLKIVNLKVDVHNVVSTLKQVATSY